MKNTLKAMILAGLMGAGSLVAAAPAEAQYYRHSGVRVYVGTGARAGYYDRWHRWHRYDRYRGYRYRSGYRHDWRCDNWRFRNHHRSYCRARW